VRLNQGDARGAFAAAEIVADMPSQAVEIPVGHMLRSAVLSGDPALMRNAADRAKALPAGGRLRELQYREGEAVAALAGGRRAEAAALFLEASKGFHELGLPFEAAECIVNAFVALPEIPAVRDAAAAERPLLEGLGARPLIDRLDEVLGRGEAVPAPATTVPAELATTAE
jgi:hypothetical protein